MNSNELVAPYSHAFLNEAVARFPQKEDTFRRAFTTIDQQLLDNYQVYNGDGVSFPFTKLSITPAVVRGITNVNPQDSSDYKSSEQSKGENRDTFCFTAYQQVNNPLSVEDMGIDEFFRNMNRVAGAMKRSEPIPNVNIYILDLPTAYGGAVT